ncbi:MAG: hypothetical protein KA072_11780 [Thermoanaerobaculaceae bacterium]|nr:hypothetical protein [Thermoanaerobaculaceae bacterium]MDI9620745.1 CheR family methyltransferase [Acidobacteriota bacterium]NLH10793.1 hypothetical protein [Holophagae bacterium]HPW56272.1 CheR family methyltransferase [Thermoanaerobaculaceae bacterium]
MTDRLAALSELARLIETASGIVVPAGHLSFLGDAAGQRAAATGCSDLVAYVQALAAGRLPGEWAALLPHVTIKESYCFRTPQHFVRLAEVVLPRLLGRTGASRRLRVWSAGCARGEEPATLAITLAEAPALAAWDWLVIGTDIDQHALGVARSGLFSGRAVAQVPPPLLERYFARRGSAFELTPSLRRRLEHHAVNLVAEPLYVPHQPFDVIFLRNVLIYFRAELQRRVVAGVTRALAPDGVLFVGPSETLWQLSEELEPEDLGDCFCYRKRKPTAHGYAPSSTRTLPAVRGAQAGTIRHATPSPERREASERRRPLPDAPAPAPSQPPLGTRERVEVAARLLAANQVEAAGATLDEVLRDDPTNAPAHVLEGLLHDLGRRPERAIASYRAALYLAPELFQARLLLAQALRRSGNAQRATGEYRQVLSSLADGRAREVEELAAIPLPDRDAAAEQARRGLQSHH